MCRLLVFIGSKALMIYLLINLIVPVVIIYLIIKGVTYVLSPSSGSGSSKQLSERDLLMGSLSFLTGVVALMFAYVLPDAILDQVGDTEEFTIRLGVAIVYILMSVIIKGEAGKPLLVTGVFIAAMQTPYIFSNFGDVTTFIVLLVAFIALIYFGVRYGKQRQQ